MVIHKKISHRISVFHICFSMRDSCCCKFYSFPEYSPLFFLKKVFFSEFFRKNSGFSRKTVPIFHVFLIYSPVFHENSGEYFEYPAYLQQIGFRCNRPTDPFALFYFICTNISRSLSDRYSPHLSTDIRHPQKYHFPYPE